MRTVTLFIAMSLDGYIADPQGSVNWLAGQEDAAEESDFYSEFLKEADPSSWAGIPITRLSQSCLPIIGYMTRLPRMS